MVHASAVVGWALAPVKLLLEHPLQLPRGSRRIILELIVQLVQARRHLTLLPLWLFLRRRGRSCRLVRMVPAQRVAERLDRQVQGRLRGPLALVFRHSVA